MPDNIIKILTSYDTPLRACVTGNEAVARGAIEASVCGVFAYPGTPSTEISEVFHDINRFQNHPDSKKAYADLSARPLYFEFSVNERIALEKGIAYSIANQRTLCCMKNVGMNVASDALMTITYQTIGAGLVIVVCDDPGCYSSSNEQDSRYWGKMASVPVFNPAAPADACEMTRDAFALSEQIKLPVIVRMTTRVDHTRGMVSYRKIASNELAPGFERRPEHINIPARTAAAHQVLVEKLEGDVVDRFLDKHSATSPNEGAGERPLLGVIASGVAAAYAREIITREADKGHKVDVLTLGLIHPFPAKIVLEFLRDGIGQVLVLEELDPIVENEVRILAQKHRLNVEILGKDYAGLSVVGEYNLDIVGEALARFTGQHAMKPQGFPAADYEKHVQELPPRPPALCAGCPHRATFYTLKLAVPREDSSVIMCGDIGCFGLGALPPLGMMDTIHHMGMSISMAQGLSEALGAGRGGRHLVALVGDGTFFHSGIPSLLNAVYTRANILVIIFDNRTIGMTGHQEHPGSAHEDKYESVELESLLRGMGVRFVETIDPFDIKSCFNTINDAIAFDGVSVVVSKSPCLFCEEFEGEARRGRRVVVDQTLCNTCHNQDDVELPCSKVVSARNGLSKARALLVAENHIPSSEQRCPANICNHGFLSSILAGDYKEALEIVRDKILFARVCGEVCHRPCEFLYRADGGVEGRTDGSGIVPIKRLKEFVSTIEENFNDFSGQKPTAASGEKRTHRVAVIGAGPAGLSAAYDLIRTGYDVTVFEKEKAAGGLLRFAIPGFRVSKEACEAEISVLRDLGVRFEFDKALGRDFALDDVADDYAAVVVAVGMGISSTLDIIDINIPVSKRYAAIEFLREFNDNTLRIEPGARILVIGGGNSAVDAARAAKRHDAKSDVIISCVETRDEMPAFEEEIESAVREGIQIIDGSDVEACVAGSGDGARVMLKSLNGQKKAWDVSCDYVITAIGQRGDRTAIGQGGLKTNTEDRIITDPAGGRTDTKNVFTAGDITAGNHVSVIGAIASGKRAAVGVRQRLEGYDLPYEGQEALDVLNSPQTPGRRPPRHSDGRLDETQVARDMPAFEIFQACAKCDHCIENFGCPALIKVKGRVRVDDFLCTRCGLCLDVCPNDAIQWAT
ncbi:MAG: FAD-dependent oxidoreductase [Candidatus Krumholzibacteria bacterium]|nr:FAD-dependent oxidoreductase [Candidatus Krumholzibacteria bacterium]